MIVPLAVVVAPGAVITNDVVPVIVLPPAVEVTIPVDVMVLAGRVVM